MKNTFILFVFGIAILLPGKSKAQNTPKQKLSLQEIQNLLKGTWAPADDDTLPYLYETYDKKKLHYSIKYAKDSAYLKIKNFNTSPDYYISFECPPDSLNYSGNDPTGISKNNPYTLPHICYIMRRIDTSKKVYVELILKITKDTLIQDDGERNYIRIKVH